MDDYLINRLNAANIPMTVHDVRLESIPGGDDLRKYIMQGEYINDRKNGIGICLCGDASLRVRLFPVFARAMSLANEDVFYAHSIVIHDVACSENHPLIEKVMNCSALFISNFCTPDEGMPYTLYDRHTIEQFLLARCNAKRRNYFSAADKLANLSWWGEDFRTDMKQFMRDVPV